MRRLTLALFVLCSSSCEAVWGNLVEANKEYRCDAAGSMCGAGEICNTETGRCEIPCGADAACISCSTSQGVESLVAALQQQSDQKPTVIRLSPGSICTFYQPLEYDMGPSALPAIRSDVIIEGNGSTLVRSANAGPFRFFYVAPPPNADRKSRLTLRNLKLQGGLAQGGQGGQGRAYSGVGRPVGPGSGGGGAGLGGAIFSQGTLVLQNVTLNGNLARGGSAAGDAATPQGLDALSYVKGGGGGGGLGASGSNAADYEGGGGGGFGPLLAEGIRGGAGPNKTEGAAAEGQGGISSGGPAEIQGTEQGSPARTNPISVGLGGPSGGTAWLGGDAGACGPQSAGGRAGNGGGGGASLGPAEMSAPGGGGGGLYSNGGDGGIFAGSKHGGGGGAYGGGGGGSIGVAGGGGGGGFGGGGGGGSNLLNAMGSNGGGGGGGGFGGGGGGGTGSFNTAEPALVSACSAGMGGFGGGGGVGVGPGSGGRSRFGGGSGYFVTGKAAFAGGGMGAGGAIFALGGWVELHDSTLTDNTAIGGDGAMGGAGLGAGIFGLATEIKLDKSTITKNTAQSGPSRLDLPGESLMPSRGAGLFVLDPGAQAPLTQTSARIDLINSTVTNNISDRADTAGADVSLEFVALGGSSRLGVLRSEGGSAGQVQNAFAVQGSGDKVDAVAGCSMTADPRPTAGVALGWLLGLAGLWHVGRGRTSRHRQRSR